MTTTYKIGDEVLVRMKIDRDGAQYRVIHNGTDVMWLLPQEIYSIAPSFNPGEEIEAKAGWGCDWVKVKFVAYRHGFTFPYVVDTAEDGICHYGSARKIQPKEAEEEITVIRNGKKYKLVEINN